MISLTLFDFLGCMACLVISVLCNDEEITITIMMVFENVWSQGSNLLALERHAVSKKQELHDPLSS